MSASIEVHVCNNLSTLPQKYWGAVHQPGLVSVYVRTHTRMSASIEVHVCINLSVLPQKYWGAVHRLGLVSGVFVLAFVSV